MKLYSLVRAACPHGLGILLKVTQHRMPSSASSIQAVTDILPCGISEAKESLDMAGTEPNQFPEGGTAAWCMVIGG